MKNKKLAMVLAVCLLLTGCGAGNAASSSQPSSQAGQGESQSEQTDESTAPESSGWEQGYLPQLAEPESGTPIVTLHTTMGDIRMMLFPQAAPLAVENFVTHCEQGYYDGIQFHRVIEGFMIQGGDPLGNGAGGESIWGAPFADEFSDNLYHFRGAVSMANSGYGTNNSQFFIVQDDAVQYPESAQRVTEENADQVMLYNTLVNSVLYENTMKMNEKAASGVTQQEMQSYVDSLNADISAQLAAGITDEVRARFGSAFEAYRELGGTPNLDYKHTVFGQVLEGMEVVDAIARVETSADKPVTDVVITSTTVETAE